MNKYRNKTRAITLLTTLLLSLSFAEHVIAQEKTNTDELKKAYPGATAVMFNREQTIKISLSGEKLVIKSEHAQQNIILGNKFTGFNERHINYAPGFYEIEKLDACTYIPQEKGYKKVKVQSFKDEGSVSGGNIFYDGIRYKKYFYLGVTEGAITETNYTYNHLDPSFVGPFYFMIGMPVIKEKFTVIVAKGIELGYKFFGDSSFVTHTVTSNTKQTIHTWEAKDVKALKSYSKAVAERYYEPHIYIYIQSYQTKNKQTVSLFGNSELLYRHNYNYIAHINKQKPVETLKILIDSINKQSTTTEEKIRNAFYWVQDHIKYIAFEDGLGGHVPREANDVFLKKYGDCKDFSSLITFMLQHMNIDAYMAWVGSRSLPYSYEELPLGYAINHMIAAVHQHDKWIFLDATSQYSPYGPPSCFTQGKEAMIAISPDSFIIEKVPVMEPKYNYSFENAALTIDDHLLKGTATLELNGYNKSYSMSSLAYMGTNKQEEFIKNMLNLGNNKCEITGFTHNNIYLKDSNMTINFTFSLPDYIRIIDNDIYINMNLRKVYADDKIDTSNGRNAAKEFEFTFEDEAVYRLEIPTDYKIKKLPDNKSYNSAHFKYDFTYEVKNNTIIYRQSSSYNKFTVEPDEFDEWNKQMAEIAKIYKDMVVLTKN